MDFLRRLILQTQNHLKGLTLSQRLAIGSCVALIAVALLWLMQWAGDPALVPLIEQPLAAQEIAPIEQRLGAMGVQYQLTNNTLMVPAEKRLQLLAQLSEVEALPKDISVGFNKLIEETSPWLSADDQAFRRNVALGNELAKALRFISGVQDARVFINREMKRTLSGPPIVPTASVFVKLAPGTELDEKRTETIARLVSGAVSGLDLTKVNVIDGRGRSRSVRAPNDLMPFDDLEDRQQKEEYFAKKIQDHLSIIPGLLAAVHAELDPESRKTTAQKYTKPLVISEKSETTNQSRSEPSGGPGVVANTSKVVTPTLSSDKTEKESTEATYEVKPESVTESISPWHGIKSLTASVNVPRSYLAAIFKRANSGKEPTDAEIDSSSKGELAKITESARAAIGAKSEAGSVVVNWFPDDATVQLGEIAGTAVAGNDMISMVRMYGSKAGLGALAVVSLFMMLMMVRKVSEGPVLPGEEPPPPQIIRIFGGKKGRSAKSSEDDEDAMPETLTVGAPPIGEAAAGEQLLVGREIDESTLRVQQVVDQVADMVRNDPETSAGILQRWMDTEKK